MKAENGAKVLTILHSNDVHSCLEAWARMESIAGRLRAERGAASVLRLDAGDHGDRAFAVTEGTRGRAHVALLAAAGVDAFTCGNNECLVWSAEHQSELAQSAPFPVLAADLRLADGRPVPGLADRVILQRAGLTVGIFGISRDVPDFLASLGLAHRDPARVAAESVRELRRAGCDLVIFLSHMGYERDRTMAAAVPGIDVIVGGHTHTVLPYGEQVGATVIVQTGSYGRYLGRLDLTVREGRVEAWQSALLETEGVEPDLATLALVRQWEAESDTCLGQVIAHLPFPLPHDPLGDSPLADLLTRRLKARFGAEAAILHGGVLLGGLPAGPVTRADLLRVCPCMLSPTLAEIPGHKLLALLALPEAELQRKIARNGMRGDTVAGRIFKAGPEVIDPDRTYRVACNDYLAFGFDPFTPLKGSFDSARIAIDQLLRDTLQEGLTGLALCPGQPVRVEAWSLSGALKKYVEATVVYAGPEEVIIRAESGHQGKAADGRVLWRSVYALDYHFWPGKEYNLLRFFGADGTWAGDYYNVGTPCAAGSGAMAYVDLELDVFLPAGEPARLLDEDELEAAPYSPDLKAHVRRIGEWLMAVAGTDAAPGGRPEPEASAEDSLGE